MVRIKAIIWDMDGVLIDSEPHHMQATIDTFSEFGVDLTPEVNQKFTGVKLTSQIAKLGKHFEIEEKVEEILKTHRKTLIKYAKEVFPLMPGALKVLEKLSPKYKMALATSSEREVAELVFHRFELMPYFQELIVGEDVEKSKPDPEPFLKAAKALGVKNDECVVIEDSQNGFKSAKGAGMILIAKKGEHNMDFDFSSADYLVSQLSEIPQILEKIAVDKIG
jgi:beta-phosphoglucomutase